MDASLYQLPEYNMTAGETQNITIMLFAKNKNQIDAEGMTARLAVSDFINQGGEPIFVKDCSIVQPAGSDLASLYCQLSPSDTIAMRGKYIYQVTAKDIDDTVSILKGIMNISGNVDQSAIL